MLIDIGQRKGMLYNLDLNEKSENYIRPTMRPIDCLPIPDYNYGYYYAGPKHYTQRNAKCDAYQIFITHGGCGRLIVDETEYLLPENSILFLDLNIPHLYETAGNYWEYEWCNFSGSCCAYYYEKINPHGLVIYDLTDDIMLKNFMHNIRNLIMQIDEQKYSETGTSILILLDALYAFSSDSTQAKAIALKKDTIQKVKQYLEDHFMDNISLDQLSGIAHLSKYHLIRIFSSYTGMTPYQYLTALRLNHARHLLMLTTMTIDEISYCTGFRNGKNLIRAFKHSTGKTPEKYRNEIRGKTSSSAQGKASNANS